MLEFNIHELINHSVELLALKAENKHLRIEQRLLVKNPIILCDGELLTQVFLNLLLNAIQIVPNGSLIRIQTSSLPHYLKIDISDSGPGIHADDYQHLFDPFFSKRDGGIGLGLTVTRQIVLAHHGKISASPSELGGACFTLQLPKIQD
jgi:signal transduction histidine kinase